MLCAVLAIVQAQLVADRPAAIAQAALCLSALGFAKPVAAPEKVWHTTRGFTDPMWVVEWAPFALHIRDNGVLQHFERKAGAYRLLDKWPAALCRDPQSAQSYMERICHQAGVSTNAKTPFIGWTRKDGSKRGGPFKQEDVAECFAALQASVDGRQFNFANIWCTARDGAVRLYFPSPVYGKAQLRAVGTFTLPPAEQP